MPRYITSASSGYQVTRRRPDSYEALIRRRREHERAMDRLTRSTAEVASRLRPPAEVSAPPGGTLRRGQGAQTQPVAPYVRSEDVPELRYQRPPTLGESSDPEGILYREPGMRRQPPMEEPQAQAPVDRSQRGNLLPMPSPYDTTESYMRGVEQSRRLRRGEYDGTSTPEYSQDRGTQPMIRAGAQPGEGTLQAARFREPGYQSPDDISPAENEALQRGVFDRERGTLRRGGAVVRTEGTLNRPARIIRFDERAPVYEAQRGASYDRAARIGQEARQREADIAERQRMMQEAAALKPRDMTPREKARETALGKAEAEGKRFVEYQGERIPRGEFRDEAHQIAFNLQERKDDKGLLQNLEKDFNQATAKSIMAQVRKYQNDPDEEIRSMANEYIERIRALGWSKVKAQAAPPKSTDEFERLRMKYLEGK